MQAGFRQNKAEKQEVLRNRLKVILGAFSYIPHRAAKLLYKIAEIVEQLRRNGA
jgi:hypothetical protein